MRDGGRGTGDGGGEEKRNEVVIDIHQLVASSCRSENVGKKKRWNKGEGGGKEKASK